MNMKNNSINETEKNFYEFNEDNELDLVEFFKSLIRNKLIILPFLLISSGFGLFDSIKRADIWKGQFQIVLENRDQKKGSGLQGLERLSAFMTSVPTSNLQTDVEILKSPSVLMPVLEFIKNEKKYKGNNIDNLSFIKWQKKSLVIDLEGGTSILNIDYQDTDKELILPVLDQISKIYQQYSTKKTKSTINQQKDYLKKQIKKFELISQSSIIDLQKYSEDYDILLPNFEQLSFDLKGNSNKLNNYLLLMNPDNDIKSQIDKTKERLNFIEKNDNESSLLMIANKLFLSDNTSNSFLIRQLSDVEKKIEKNSSVFKKEDPLIVNLKAERKSLIENIRINTVSTLNSKLSILENIRENNSKPKEVISQFRDLFGKALRNSITLQSLEQELHLTSLQEARTEVPWKLITNPTLLTSPVGPFRFAIFMRAVFIGLFIGSLVSILFDFKKNVISNENRLRKIVNLKLVEKLKVNNIDNWSEDIKILFNGFIKANKYESLSIITLGNFNNIYKQKVENELQRYFVKGNFLITDNILKANDFKNVLLLIAKGSISKSELTKQLNRISLQNMNLIGWILID